MGSLSLDLSFFMWGQRTHGWHWIPAYGDL